MKKFGKIAIAIIILWGAAIIIFMILDQRTISRNDVIGKYISNYKQSNYREANRIYPEYQGGIHQLELKDDDTYVYHFTSFDGKDSRENSGMWKFEYSSGRRKASIVLPDFAFGTAQYQNNKISTSLPVIRYFGNIRAIINDDHGYYFEKGK